MTVVYPDAPIPPGGGGVFLAGPSPRGRGGSWRPAALDVLREFGFAGPVFVPERPDWSVKFDYLDQVEWEFAGLEACAAVAFWVPRDVAALPGFTTNVEFGRYVGRKPCAYGRPPDAPHTRYLDWLYTKLTGDMPADALRATLAAAVSACNAGGNS